MKYPALVIRAVSANVPSCLVVNFKSAVLLAPTEKSSLASQIICAPAIVFDGAKVRSQVPVADTAVLPIKIPAFELSVPITSRFLDPLSFVYYPPILTTPLYLIRILSLALAPVPACAK